MFQLLLSETPSVLGDGRAGSVTGILQSESWSTGPCDEWEIDWDVEAMTQNSKLTPWKDWSFMTGRS